MPRLTRPYSWLFITPLSIEFLQHLAASGAEYELLLDADITQIHFATSRDEDIAEGYLNSLEHSAFSTLIH